MAYVKLQCECSICHKHYFRGRSVSACVAARKVWPETVLDHCLDCSLANIRNPQARERLIRSRLYANQLVGMDYVT